MAYFCKIRYFNENYDESDRVEYKAITANSLGEAAAAIEDYYGPELTSVEIKLTDESLIDISEENFVHCWDI